MSLPSGWTQVPVTGTFRFRNGDPLAGKRITFESDQVVAIDGEVIVPKRLQCVLDDDGAVPAGFTLPSTNDPDLSVTGWAYTVAEKWPGGREYAIFVPYDSAGIDLAEVSPAVDPDELVSIEAAAMATAVYVAATAAKEGAETAATTATTQAGIATAAAEASINVKNELVSTDEGKGASLVGFLQSGTGAVARTVQDKARDVVSVLDFINPSEHAAIIAGTSTYDCTVDIQKALDYQGTRQVTVSGTGGGRGGVPAVHFPFGVYNISEPLEVKTSYLHLTGEDAVIAPHSGGFTGGYAMFATINGWRPVIRGLQFQDFDTAVYLNSNNVDTGRVLLDRCGFYNNETAIHLVCQSSYIELANCMFTKNVHELRIEKGDWVVMRGGWITRGTLVDDYDGGIIVEDPAARFTMDSVVTVPSAQTVTEPAWIKSYGSVACTRTRFGGEAGQHTVVNQFGAGTDSVSAAKNYIHIDRCDLYVGGNPAVRLFEMPNIISVCHNVGLTTAGAAAVGWSSSVDSGAQATKIAAMTMIGDRRYAIAVRGNVTSLDTVPDNLLHITDSDTKRLISSKTTGTNDRKLTFDVRNSTIPNGTVMGEIEWLGRDADTNASGVRARVYGKANSGTGGAEVVIAAAASSSATPTEVAKFTNAGMMPAVDGVAALGTSSMRFSNLFLGSGVYVGASGAAVKVVGARDVGWTAMTGTGSKAALAAAAAGTASAAYTQSELQTALNRIAALEARLKSLDAALIAHGLIGP